MLLAVNPPLALTNPFIVNPPVSRIDDAVIAVLALIILAVNAPVTVNVVNVPFGMVELPVKLPLASVTKNKLLPLICRSINGYCPLTRLALVCAMTIIDAVELGYGIIDKG